MDSSRGADMDRALVVVDGEEVNQRLLTRAGTLAAGVGATLFVVGVIDADEYESEVQRKANRGTEPSTLDEVTEVARRSAEDAATAVLDDLDVEYETVGLVGDLPDDLIAEAHDRDCDHVFVAGRRRSPTGKVIFGDLAQSVILNFDGPVTVMVED